MSSDRVQLEKQVFDPGWQRDAKEEFHISVLAHLTTKEFEDGRVILQNHSGSKGYGSPQVIDVPLFAAVEIYHLLGDALRQVGLVEEADDEE